MEYFYVAKKDDPNQRLVSDNMIDDASPPLLFATVEDAQKVVNDPGWAMHGHLVVRPLIVEHPKKSFQDFFDQFPNGVSVYGREGSIAIHWSYAGMGCGELRFYEHDGKLMCSNECMGKESIKKILGMMVDISTLEDRRCPHCGNILRVLDHNHEDDIQFCDYCFHVEP